MLVSTLNPNRVVFLLIIKLLRGGPALPGRPFTSTIPSVCVVPCKTHPELLGSRVVNHDDVPGAGYGSPVLVTADPQVFSIG